MTVPVTPYQVRRAPTQYRASRQIERILVSATEVVAEKGFSATTTADIAKAAGVSIGSVYRYFPDKVAVMRAVLERNNLRFLQRVAEALPADSWRAIVETGYHIYVDMCRSDVGFRAVSSAGLTSGELQKADELDGPLAESLADLLVAHFGFADTPGLRLALLQVITIGDVLTRLAFRLDVDGHPDTLDQYRRIALDLIAPHAPNPVRPVT